MKKPSPCPTSNQIHEAVDIYRAWQLHYYQLLFFQQPRLTEPGRPASPFFVDFDPEHHGCLKLICNRNPEYTFTIYSYLPTGMTQEQYDADILRKCRLILDAIKANKQKIQPRVCCGLAEPSSCVCYFSWTCEIHSGGHVGTHD